MQRKAKSFFLLLMLTFLLGILIHLIIPIQIVVNATQNIEEAYNGYKIEVEQNMVRSIAYLNSLAISNQVQIYENVRSSVIRAFDVGNKYDETDLQRIKMNSAYQLANRGSIEPAEVEHSMWFISGVTNYSQMNPEQYWMMLQFAQLEQYLSAIASNNSFHQGLQAIQITINFSNQQIYFEYPSSIKPQFKNLSTNILSSDYNTTVLNFKTSNRYQTLIDQITILKACSSILSDGQPFAVVCLKLDVNTVMEQITGVLKVPNFQLSNSRYYLLKPLYKFQNNTYPQVIAYFSSDDLQTIHYPVDTYFTQIPTNLPQIFSNSTNNYLLNVQQLQKTKTYYVMPIETYNNMDTKEIIMYLAVVNDFAKSDLKSASHYKQFFVVMIVPSTILLIISALAMGFIMRPLFKKLRYYSTLMNDYCHYIHKNDMNLEITEQGQTSDFVQIFKNIRCLNLLNKLSTLSYLKVSENERIIKLLRALQLFDQLGFKQDHNKVNVYENLAYCYHRTGESANAIRYLQKCIDISIKQLGGLQKIQQLLKPQPQPTSPQKPKLPQSKKSPIRHLRYKIFKLCSILYETHIPGDTTITENMSKNVQLLQKLLTKSSVNVQYLYCYLLESICLFQNGVNLSVIAERLENSGDIIRSIECSNFRSKIMPHQILKSYRYYLKAIFLKRQSQYLESYEAFILALGGERFDPELHKKIKKEIVEILEVCQIETTELEGLFKIEDLNVSYQDIKAPKQFIFLSDVSNPNLSMRQFNEWKGKARKMAEYIFDKFITAKDRIGISEFCNDIKVICNLIQKKTNENTLKKQLMGSIKARDQTIYSQLIPNIRRVIERTKNLKRQKIFIIFLKEGIQINPEDVLEEIGKIANSTFIFLVAEGSRRFTAVQEGFYVVDFQGFQSVEIILGEKVVKKADNIVYLF